MNKEEAMKILQHYLEMEEFNNAGDFLIAIDIVLNLIQKQDKIIDNYKEMIINHKKQLKQSGIYGYDYDLNIIEKEVEKDEERT